MSLTLGAFLGQNMTQVALLALEAASTRSFEAFGRSTITFHLWHSELPFIIQLILLLILHSMSPAESEYVLRRGTLFVHEVF